MTCDVHGSSLLSVPHELYEEKSNVFSQNMQMLLFEQNLHLAFHKLFSSYIDNAAKHNSQFCDFAHMELIYIKPHGPLKSILKNNMGYKNYFC